jgi:hypothetical protein
MLRISKNDPLVETYFSLFTNIVNISIWRNCSCHEYSMEYSAKYHLVENYFQLYINLVDEST